MILLAFVFQVAPCVLPSFAGTRFNQTGIERLLTLDGAIKNKDRLEPSYSFSARINRALDNGE